MIFKANVDRFVGNDAVQAQGHHERWIITLAASAIIPFLIHFTYITLPLEGAERGNLGILFLSVAVGAVPLWSLPTEKSTKFVLSLAFFCVMLLVVGISNAIYNCSLDSTCFEIEIRDAQGNPSSM